MILGWVLGSVCGHGNGTLGKLRLRSPEPVSYSGPKILFSVRHNIWKLLLFTRWNSSKTTAFNQSPMLTRFLNLRMSYGGITIGSHPLTRQEKKEFKDIMENGCLLKLQCSRLELMQKTRNNDADFVPNRTVSMCAATNYRAILISINHGNSSIPYVLK